MMLVQFKPAEGDNDMSGKRTDYLSWDEYFMGVAMLSGMRSKDPNTQVGCCIVSQDNKILSMGYNGFSDRGVRTMNSRGRGKAKIPLKRNMCILLTASLMPY